MDEGVKAKWWMRGVLFSSGRPSPSPLTGDTGDSGATRNPLPRTHEGFTVLRTGSPR